MNFKTTRLHKNASVTLPQCQFMINRNNTEYQCLNSGVQEIEGKDYCIVHVKRIRKLSLEN